METLLDWLFKGTTQPNIEDFAIQCYQLRNRTTNTRLAALLEIAYDYAIKLLQAKFPDSDILR